MPQNNSVNDRLKRVESQVERFNPPAAITASRKPGRPRSASSFVSVVADLEVGECASRVTPISASITLSDLADEVKALKQTAYNNAAPSIRQARAQTGGEYTVSTTYMHTDALEHFIVLIVRRTA